MANTFDAQVPPTSEASVVEGAQAKEEGEHGQRAPHGEHQVSFDR